jgi:outer membrane protein OmpA-like peptidoglycan-associated protein
MSSRRQHRKPKNVDDGGSMSPRGDRQEPARAAVERHAPNAALPPRLWEAGNAAMSDLLGRLGEGRPIPAATQKELEQAFGADFSDVRIHDDEDARAQADALSADAFTHGNDIALGAEAPSPDSSPGKKLLAHELAHVVQQRLSGGQHSTVVSQPGDRFEAGADEAAASSVAGQPVHLTTTGAPPSIQRQPAEQSFGEKALDFLLNKGISYSDEGWKIGGIPIEKVSAAAKTSAKILSKIIQGDLTGALEIVNPKDPDAEKRAWEKILKIKEEIDSLRPIVEQEREKQEAAQRKQEEIAKGAQQGSKNLGLRPPGEKIEFPELKLSEGLRGGAIALWLVDEFDLEKSQLKSRHRKILNDLAAQVISDPGAELEIVGHTDSSGPDNLNQKLSGQRANAVVDYLLNRGVSPGKIKSVAGKGSAEPFVAEKSDADRAQNRRVEIYYKPGKDENRKPGFGLPPLRLNR